MLAAMQKQSDLEGCMGDGANAFAIVASPFAIDLQVERLLVEAYTSRPKG